MSSSDDGRDWTDYNATQIGRAPRQLVRAAMDVAGAGRGRTAVELGCGVGVEARALADDGWQVHTFDADPSVVPAVEALRGERWIQHTVGRLEELRTLPDNELTLASLSLPFVDRDAFPDLWRLALGALRPGGLLAVDLFGHHDDWAAGPGTFLTRAEVDALVAPLVVVSLSEDEWDGTSFSGPKHWHAFQVLARTPAGGQP